MRMNEGIPKIYLREIIKRALKEDIGEGDITSFFCIPFNKKIKAYIIAKEEGILCGIDVAKEVFTIIDPSTKFKKMKEDGEKIRKNEKVAQLTGKATNILIGERVALNFLSLLSGVATQTHYFVKKISKTKVKIRDTRKTTPNLRLLEKYAVRIGGGINHRKGLWDGILIKDNHLRVYGIVKKRIFNKSKLKEIIETIRKSTSLEIEVEVENLSHFKEAIKCNPDIILLDNFKIRDIKKAVKFRNRFFPKVKLEASGGINLDNVKDVALSGVEFISVGSITHSPESIDFSLEVDG